MPLFSKCRYRDKAVKSYTVYAGMKYATRIDQTRVTHGDLKNWQMWIKLQKIIFDRTALYSKNE